MGQRTARGTVPVNTLICRPEASPVSQTSPRLFRHPRLEGALDFMRSTSGSTRSPWMNEPAPGSADRLGRETRTGICIVGAGISGLTAALLAGREGRQVVVIDRGAVADGETARTTAHLTYVLDRRYFELERLHGRKAAALAAQSHVAAIAGLEAIVRQENITCDFKRASAYLLAGRGRSPRELEREFAAARRAGLEAVEWVERAPWKAFDTGPCLHFPHQARLHPLHFIRGLVATIRRNGGLVVEYAHASDIATGRPGRVTLEDGRTIVADEIVIATNAPIHSRIAMHAYQSAWRTFVIGVNVPRGSVYDALYYDTLKPYHYVRIARASHPHETQDVLIVGGEDHPTGMFDDAKARWKLLERWTRERFPASGKLAWRWSGQVFEPHDGLACIGHDRGAAHLSLITGGSGSGMTYAMIAANILADQWSGRKNPWAALYKPTRKPRKFTPEATAQGAWDQASPVTPRTAASLARGEGAVVHRSGHAYAVYRDAQGAVRRWSAKCTHLGCDVVWNSAEKSWDCPCHGSRFNRKGQVVTGPAIESLKPVAARTAKK